MIRLENITIGNREPLIEQQNVRLDKGTLTALVGRNGCGKSTLLRVIAGLQKPIAGRVEIDGKDVGEMSAQQRAETIAVVTSESTRVEHLTCEELVALGRSPYTGMFGSLSNDDRAKVREAMKIAGIEPFIGREVCTLSDGENRRVMLAKALAQDTPVILLDEPTSFLDVPGRFEICELLAKLAADAGKTILYSTHELQPAFHFANQIMFMNLHGLDVLPPQEMCGRELFVKTMRLDLLE